MNVVQEIPDRMVFQEPVMFDRVPTGLLPPPLRQCECGQHTQNCDGVCETCRKLDSDEFGRIAPVGYSTICDCDLCQDIWSE